MTAKGAESAACKPRRLPGDPTRAELIDRMIRVDHAGEYGAVRIYEGQLAVLGAAAAGPVIRGMAEQERRHLETFARLLVDHKARPTALLPLWHLAGYLLGAGSALLGERAAMACTVAVEEVIDGHYRRQIDQLDEADAGLKETFAACRADELEHRAIGLAHGAEETLAYAPLAALVKAGSRLAIWLSERL